MQIKPEKNDFKNIYFNKILKINNLLVFIIEFLKFYLFDNVQKIKLYH